MADIRVSRTNKMLCEAFDELMLEKAYDNITVSEICERSTVRRGTFYKHFEDKDALMRYHLNTITESFLEQAKEADGVDELETYASYMQTLLVAYIERHPVISRYVLRKNAPVGVLDMMVDQVADGIVARVAALQESGRAICDIDAAFIGTFYAGGMTHMLRLWLAADKPYSAEELVRRCTELLMNSCMSPDGA